MITCSSCAFTRAAGHCKPQHTNTKQSCLQVRTRFPREAARHAASSGQKEPKSSRVMHAIPSLRYRKLMFSEAMKKRTRECCLPAPQFAVPRQAADIDQRSTQQQQDLYWRCLDEESDVKRRASIAPAPASDSASARWLQLTRCSSCSSFQQRSSAPKPTAAPSEGSSGRRCRRGVPAKKVSQDLLQ